MFETFSLVAIFATGYFGFALLALSLARHWLEVAGRRVPPPSSRRFRDVGYAGLALGWGMAVLRDGPGMGSLLWAASLSVAAAALALTLAWWPLRLRPFALAAGRLIGNPLASRPPAEERGNFANPTHR